MCDVCHELPCKCEGQSDWKGLHGKLWALMQRDAPTPAQQRVREKKPWYEVITCMSPEEQCEMFCVGRMAKYGCRVCKPGFRWLQGLGGLSDADSQQSSGEENDSMPE